MGVCVRSAKRGKILSKTLKVCALLEPERRLGHRSVGVAIEAECEDPSRNPLLSIGIMKREAARHAACRQQQKTKGTESISLARFQTLSRPSGEFPSESEGFLHPSPAVLRLLSSACYPSPTDSTGKQRAHLDTAREVAGFQSAIQDRSPVTHFDFFPAITGQSGQSSRPQSRGDSAVQPCSPVQKGQSRRDRVDCFSCFSAMGSDQAGVDPRTLRQRTRKIRSAEFGTQHEDLRAKPDGSECGYFLEGELPGMDESQAGTSSLVGNHSLMRIGTTRCRKAGSRCRSALILTLHAFSRAMWGPRRSGSGRRTERERAHVQAESEVGRAVNGVLEIVTGAVSPDGGGDLDSRPASHSCRPFILRVPAPGI